MLRCVEVVAEMLIYIIDINFEGFAVPESSNVDRKVWMNYIGGIRDGSGSTGYT